jgi:hypothetical protein
MGSKDICGWTKIGDWGLCRGRDKSEVKTQSSQFPEHGLINYIETPEL